MGRRHGLRGLPEDLQTERRGGSVFDPNAGLALDWINRYKTTNFGAIVNTNSITILQNNALRCYLLIQNQNAANDLFLSFTNDASAVQIGSIIVPPRGNYELIGGEAGGSFVPKDSVNLVSAVAAGINVTIVEGTLEPYELSGRME